MNLLSLKKHQERFLSFMPTEKKADLDAKWKFSQGNPEKMWNEWKEIYQSWKLTHKGKKVSFIIFKTLDISVF